MGTAPSFAVLLEFCKTLFQGGYRTPEERQAAETRRKVPQFSLLGPLSAGKSTQYSINGIDFEIDRETSVLGELLFGATARVSGIYRQHTIRCARKIMVEPKRAQTA